MKLSICLGKSKRQKEPSKQRRVNEQHGFPSFKGFVIYSEFESPHLGHQVFTQLVPLEHVCHICYRCSMHAFLELACFAITRVWMVQ